MDVSTHGIDLVRGTRRIRIRSSCVSRRVASQSSHDRAVLDRNSGCDRIPPVVYRDVCHSFPNSRLVIANASLGQRVVLVGPNQAGDYRQNHCAGHFECYGDSSPIFRRARRMHRPRCGSCGDSSLRYLLITRLLLLSSVAFAGDKASSCELVGKSVVSRSSSGLAQVSNLGDIQITCSAPARPYSGSESRSLRPESSQDSAAPT